MAAMVGFATQSVLPAVAQSMARPCVARRERQRCAREATAGRTVALEARVVELETVEGPPAAERPPAAHAGNACWLRILKWRIQLYQDFGHMFAYNLNGAHCMGRDRFVFL